MTQPRPELIAAADPEARSLARGLIGANHAALAYLDPATQTPGISRIALGLCPEGWPLTLISELAPHTAALRANPAAALMVGAVPILVDNLTSEFSGFARFLRGVRWNDGLAGYLRRKHGNEKRSD